MLVKVAIIIVLFVIIGSLASAMIFLVRDKDDSTRTLKALTWRIGLSVSLFALLMIGYAAGVIKPHGIYPAPPAAVQAAPAE